MLTTTFLKPSPLTSWDPGLWSTHLFYRQILINQDNKGRGRAWIDNTPRVPNSDLAIHCVCIWASLVTQTTKDSACNVGDPVWSLGWEDPLEKEMATHSSNLAWRTPWTEEPGGLQSMRSQRVRHDWVTNTQLFFIQLCQSLSIYLLKGISLSFKQAHIPPYPRYLSISSESSVHEIFQARILE